jgi:two-component system phosphate regulon sensor histidine kinase PhoR
MKTLRGKMFALVAATILLALALGLTFVTDVLQDRLQEQANRELSIQTAALTEVIQTQGLEAVSANLDEWHRLLGGRITLINESGRVLLDSLTDAESLENHGRRPEVKAALEDGEGRDVRFSRSINTNMMYLARKARTPDGRDLIVRTAYPMSYLEGIVSAARNRLILGMALAAAIAVFIGSFFLRGITRPLFRLTQAATRLERGEPAAFPMDGTEEVRTLSRALQQMADRLQSSMEETLKEKTTLRALLESLPVAVIVVDSRGNVVYANQALGGFLREQPGKIEGLPVQGTLKAPELTGLIEKARAGTAGQVSFILREKEERFINAQAAPTPYGTVAVLSDLTERHRMEEAKSAFVADASHELQTPLTVIRAATELLMDESLQGEERHRFLQRIVEQQERMTALVEDLLLLSRLESGVPVERTEKVDLGSLLASLLEGARLAPEADQLQWEASIPAVAEVQGRYEELRRAFGNLIDNAAKYTIRRFGTNMGGHVRVSLEPKNDGWLFSVQDNGVGIPPGMLDRIFERFQRAEAHRSRNSDEKGGYGLGLSIARRVAESHKGWIRVESPGEGAKFTLWLPA